MNRLIIRCKFYFSRKLLIILPSLFFIISCQKDIKRTESNTETVMSARFDNNGNGWGNVSPKMVLRWNEAAVYVVYNTPQAPPNPPIPPFIESRYYAMVNVAMHDALNNIVPKYKTLALQNARDKDANPDAAVAQAAHDVIAFFFGQLNPPAFFTPQPVQGYIHALLTQSLSIIPDGAAKTKGIALGSAAAQAIIQNRANDGIANVMFPVDRRKFIGTVSIYFSI